MKLHSLVKHVISVYHEDAFLGYDLQLLHSHPNGLTLLQKEAQRVVDGNNRWSSILKRVVGHPEYHAGLIELAHKAKSFEYPATEDLDPRFVTLTGFAQFCLSLPKWPAREFYGFDLDKLRKRR